MEVQEQCLALVIQKARGLRKKLSAGGGAPMRDQYGNILASRKPGQDAANTAPAADLRSMNQDLKEKDQTGQISARPEYQPPPESYSPRGGAPKDEGDHSRGGHGIFGEPMTNAQKTAKDRYQDELRIQMEEKKRQAKAEKDRERQEDERLMRKIEEDNKKLQDELENEKRKEREKHEAAQRAQEELRRQQEDKRKEEEKKRREVDEARDAERRRQLDEEARQRRLADQQRTASPAIPTLRSKTEPPPSPAVPAVRTASRTDRVQSANVLNQLARMRQQLQSERARVEGDLQKQTNDEPEVYDPRLYSKPSNHVDVFEVARKREPVTVRRGDASPSVVKDFDSLRNKKDTDSRQQFRNLFPDDPSGPDALETQQRALLIQQEEELAKLRQRPAVNDRDIDLPGNRVKSRNDSARNRRRQRDTRPRAESGLSNYKDPLGSVVSLDPDNINKRNEERLRKLKSLNGDDISTTDPDDILDRFMSKQQHQRKLEKNGQSSK